MASYPLAVTTLPEPGPGTFEDDPAYNHDELHTVAAQEIKAIEADLIPQRNRRWAYRFLAIGY